MTAASSSSTIATASSATRRFHAATVCATDNRLSLFHAPQAVENESVLPLLGIAALMVFGFVVLMMALTYDLRTKPDTKRERAPTHRRRSQAARRWRQAQHALDAGRTAVYESAVGLRGRILALAATSGTWAVAQFEEWWPRFRERATDIDGRWLTLESPSLQVLVGAVGSVLCAYLIVAFA